MQIKKLLAVPALLFTQACSNVQSYEGYMPVNNMDTISTAIEFINYDERNNREELKEFTGVDPVRTEWCAAFLNAVLEESGVPSPETLGHKYPLTARSYLTWGQSVEFPLPGDIVVFPRGDIGWQGHVGIFIEQREINGVLYYMILGGNQDNSVSITSYRASSALDIRRMIL